MDERLSTSCKLEKHTSPQNQDSIKLNGIYSWSRRDVTVSESYQILSLKTHRAMYNGIGPFPVLQAKKRVLGCGSNVVDHIYKVKVVPKAGEKGFFLSPFKALDAKQIGGATLNHLCWAALGGVPTGLLALQGQDDLGIFIRTNLKKLGVATEFIQAEGQYSTAQRHVFIQENGERSILMAPAATSLISMNTVQDHFDGAIQEHACMVTTEISQVPLCGVLQLLESARKADVPSVLDLDIPPSVAVHEAQLGGMEELMSCVKNADILKPAKSAAEGLLKEMVGDKGGRRYSLLEIATELVRHCGSKLVVITNGGKPSILANKDIVVEVPPPAVDRVVDTTGAGDAFLGGLIVGFARHGFPTTKEELRNLGRIANAYGAACVQSVGGVPTDISRKLLQRYLPDADLYEGSVASKLHGFNTSLKNDLQAAALLADRIDQSSLATFMNIIDECKGQLLTSGIGKSGFTAQRFAGTLSSLGIMANYVNAAEWIHGDLGKARPGRDVVVFFSHSGNTAECVTAASQLVARGVTTLTVTGNRESKLSKLSMASLTYNFSPEDLKEPFQCLPTSSLVIQDLLCNAITCELIQRRGIGKDMFRLNHPGGSIGSRLKNSGQV